MGLPLRTALDSPQEWNTFRTWLLGVWDFAASLPYFDKARGPWLPDVAYASNDYVTHDGMTYVAMDAHESSSSFTADEEAGHWLTFNSTAFLAYVDAAADQVALAAAQVGLAGSRAIAADAARIGAVSALDTAMAILNRRMTKELAVADGSIVNMAYFTTPSPVPGEAAIVWQKVDGVAIDTLVRVPDAAFVARPLPSESGYLWTLEDLSRRMSALMELDGTFVPFKIRLQPGSVLSAWLASGAVGFDKLAGEVGPGVARLLPAESGYLWVLEDLSRRMAMLTELDGTFVPFKIRLPAGAVTASAMGVSSVAMSALASDVIAAIAAGQSVSGNRERAAAVGSSQTELNFVSPLYGPVRRLNRSWLDWANYHLGEKAIDIRYTHALGGSRIDQIFVQIQAAVLEPVELIVGDLGVINSVADGASVGTMKAQVKQCIDAIHDAGKKGFLLNATPLAAGHVSATLSTHRKMAEVNRYMAAYGREKGIVIIDAHATVVDGTSSNGYAKAALLQADLIHYAQAGARLIGKDFAAAAAPKLTAYPLLPSSQADTYNATDNPNQLCANPLMTGSVAVSGASGITGVMPTGLSLSASDGTFTGTSSVVARADGYGQDWVLTITGASAAAARLFVTLSADMNANVAAGDSLYAASAVDITGMSNLKGHLFRLSPSQGSVYAGIHEITTETSAITEYSQADLSGGIFLSPTLVVPAASTNLRLILEVQFSSTACSAVIKVGRVSVPRI